MERPRGDFECPQALRRGVVLLATRASLGNALPSLHARNAEHGYTPRNAETPKIESPGGAAAAQGTTADAAGDESWMRHGWGKISKGGRGKG